MTTRQRTTSATEEANVTTFVDSCTNYQTTVKFFGAESHAEATAKNILLVGTASELADDAIKGLPFYCVEVAKAIEMASNGSIFSTFIKVATSGDELVRFSVGIVPSTASRHNCATRPDKISGLVSAAIKDGKSVSSIDIYVRSSEELCVANAVARANTRNFSAKNGNAMKSYLEEGVPMKVFFPAKTLKSAPGHLETTAKFVQLCQRLVDAPTNLLDTTTFAEIAAVYAQRHGLGVDIIKGEDLRERGYGGLYGVGKAASFPPALVTLSYKPKDGIDPKSKIAFVGKGIVFDTGGLSIKAGVNMCGMKRDMGGAAAVLCGFLAAVEMNVAHQLSVSLCLADNAVGPLAQRNDDIVIMKSGLTVEINNTDAEGRLVLGDGVFHATTELGFTPDLVCDMATLTGAQGIATGKYHAAIFSNSGVWETRVCDAGRSCGDLCFPVVYCPEFHNVEFNSKVADYRNSVANRGNAQASCAGSFIGNNLSKSYEGAWVHVDLAAPATHEEGTGFGVTLIAKITGDF